MRKIAHQVPPKKGHKNQKMLLALFFARPSFLYLTSLSDMLLPATHFFSKPALLFGLSFMASTGATFPCLCSTKFK